MWDGGPGEHPDEGTIHAWLDGALDAASAERVAAHVRGCAACSALTAEARGLIAGASRVIASLDDVPPGARPAWAQSEADGADATAGAASAAPRADRSLWRRLRVTPARAAIAATIIVAAGLTLTHERAAKESVVTLPAGHSELRSDGGSGVVASAPPAVGSRKDAALDSAVAKNLSIAQGKPSMEASRQMAIPQAPASAAPVENGPVAMAEERVASGRAAVQALRDTTAGVAPDKLRVGSATTAASAARAADEAAIQQPARAALRREAPAMAPAAANVSQGYADTGARSCYSLESSESGARWGDQPLPLVVMVDSGPAAGTRSAIVRSAATDTEVRATWTRSDKDSVVITLERVGMRGTIALGPSVGGRAGTATSGGIAASPMASTERRDADTRARAKSVAPSPAPSAEPNAATGGAVGTSARRTPDTATLPVTLRPVACPVR
jgi:hypothetical protein